jgi:hypothetical protein
MLDTARLGMLAVMPIVAGGGRASSLSRAATQAAHRIRCHIGVEDLEWAVERWQGGLQESSFAAASAAELFEGEEA